MGTVAGVNTRRYHGLLVAAAPGLAQRFVLLDSVEAFLTTRSQETPLSTSQYAGAIYPEGWRNARAFSVGRHAEWEIEAHGSRLIRRIGVPEGRNAAVIEYEMLEGQPSVLVLRPLVCFKPYHENFAWSDRYPASCEIEPEGTRVRHEGWTLDLSYPGAAASEASGWYYRFHRAREAERGLPDQDDLYCPVQLSWPIAPGEKVRFCAWADEGGEPDFAFGGLGEPGNPEDDLRAACSMMIVATGERTALLAGYPWFTDWGRDTMIALPGACLGSGRIADARSIIRSCLRHMRRGLIPNRFEDGGGASYNTVDATLWMAHAIHQTLLAEWDEEFAKECLAGLEESCEWHQKGTDFGIGADPEDGLLAQGGAGLQLTWMDAKIGDWVATPRHGKPVEVNGLWVNFLRVIEWLMARLGRDGLSIRLAAEKAEASFMQKFWREQEGWFLDTAEPDDASLRPNQILAMGLPFSPMSGPEADRALEACLGHLWTPRGLRTLAPRNANFRPRFEGDMASRDSAYHQGTVWPWLTGSLIAAVLRVRGDAALAGSLLQTQMGALHEQGFFGVAEVYDATAPHRPGGCPWQAWSAAELLRAHRMISRFHAAGR